MSIINNTLMAYDISYQEIDLIVTSLMTVFTLGIVIFNLIYLIYIRDTNPTYIRSKEIHSEKIKEIASNWDDEISNTMKEIFFIEKKQDKYLAEVEKDYFFNDLKEHDPKNLNMFKTWDEFKIKMDEINSLKYDLIKKINDKINSQTGLIYNENLDSPGNTFTFQVANKILIKIDKIFRGEMYRPYIVDDFKIDGNKEIEGEHYSLITHYAKAINKDIQCLHNLQQFLTTKLKDTSNEEGWNDDLKKIYEIHSQLNGIRAELKTKINEFKSLPIYPEDCEIIKRVKKPFFWKIKNKFK